jgi:hypothetical protein
VLLGLLVCTGTAAGWEVRYAQQPDQRPEWDDAGYLPSWEIRGDPGDAEGMRWGEHDGSSRGWIAVGQRRVIPQNGADEIRFRFEIQTWCEAEERSGTCYVFVAEVSAWEALAATPEQARPLNVYGGAAGWETLCVLAQGSDRREWLEIGPVPAPVPEVFRPGTEVVVGVLWGAAHYHCREGGALRALEAEFVSRPDGEREFWAALDLSRPELTAVAAAVEAEDLRAADHEFGQYLRRRDGPVYGRPVGGATAEQIRAAEEILDHTYRLLGCPVHRFAEGIAWNADPFDYEQWAIQLNRHAEWTVLAAAYKATQAPRFALEWERQLLDWIDAMPVYIGKRWIEGPYNRAGKMPLSLDAGIRMGQTWLRAYQELYRCPEIAPETLTAFARSCYRHALYLALPGNFHSGSNWGAMELNGLFHIAVFFPEFRDAQRWQQLALDRLRGELVAQVYPDGVQHELTPGYHTVTLANFRNLLEMARANRMALPEDLEQVLEEMYACLLRIATPGLYCPPLNDSNRVRLTSLYRDAAALFPDRPEFRWVVSGRTEAHPPPYLSTVLPYAGWVAMRSGWAADDRYLLFDAGPFGTGHQHEDKLSVLVYAYGHELLTDAGTYAYDESAWRRYVLSTRAHSTVRMDGMDQACRLDRAQFLATRPDTYGFHSDDWFDYARDTHTSGYGPGPDRSAVHRRRVAFVRPDYWVVVDDYAATDNGEHLAEAQFLVNAADGELDPRTGEFVSTPAGPQGARIAVLPLFRVSGGARVVRGQTEPEVRGFVPAGFENLRPRPAVIYEVPFRRQRTVAWALVPFVGTLPPVQVARVQEQDGGLQVELEREGRGVVRVGLTSRALQIGRVFMREEVPLNGEE